ncbi:hypothetical protein ACLOJK_001336 [Asimina triloba]
MESARERRSLGPPMDNEERGEEDKMERFFDLLKRIKATKEMQRNEAHESKKKRRLSGEIRVPSFRWEDFSREIKFRSPSIVISKSFKMDEKMKEDDGLDLNLSL